MKSFYQKIKVPLWIILSGFLTSLPLVITQLGFLQWVAIFPVAIMLIRSAESDIKLRKLYGRGVLFFAVYYAVSFHWFFYMYPLDFAGLSNAASIAVVLIACFGLGLFQAVQSALMFLLFGLVSRTDAVKNNKIVMPFLAASLWVVIEWWQTVGWWGVPWGRLPLGQMSFSLLVRSSALFGSYFVTFIIVAVNFCLALVIDRKSIKLIGVALAISLFCLNLALGAIVTVTYKNDGEVVKAAAIQGNIPSSEKWDINSKSKVVAIYKELTEKAAAEGAELVVWPETALPYVLSESQSLTEFVTDLAKDNNITLIVSVFTVDEETDARYNSILEVKPDGSFGETVYSKQRLVPFGEFVPMREFVTLIFPPLANVGMLEDDLLAGDSSEVIDSEIGKIGCGICFDSIYENLMIESTGNGAEVLVVSTNDSWFSDSAALDMHNSQSRLRAIENGRYLVRAANTGISSVIDPLGNVKGELGALERGYVVEEITLHDKFTLYSSIGNLFVYLCMAFYAGLLAFSLCQKGNIKFIKKS
ncbi:MAG: apolipoprotein N-acyltransferase [Ruminococcaceae bacterium]|nr:apolipoprotein N-acyltransferase [Oscillospiraceae bacterium]